MSGDVLQQAIDRGNAARRAGKLEEALGAYREAMRVAPLDAEAASLCGLTLLHLERIDEAEPLLLSAVQRAPHQIAFRMNLAELLEARGRFSEAIAALESVTRVVPQFSRAWERLGEICMRARRYSDAYRFFGRASATDPSGHSALVKGAQAALALSKLKEARYLLERASRISPNNSAILTLYADTIEGQADWASLERLALSWTNLRPNEGRAWKALSTAYWETGRLHRAVEAHRKVLELNGRTAENLATHGRLCVLAFEFDEAVSVLSEAEVVGPKEVHVLSAQAMLMMMLGRFEDSERYCQQSLEIDPRDVTAFTVLNRLKPGRFSDTEMATLKGLSEKRDLRPEHRISAAYVLADTLHARDRIDEAFATYESANVLRREYCRAQGLFYDRIRRSGTIDTLIQLFPSIPPATGQTGGACPVFIVGMPRSGTTLVESVIAAHPRVRAFGERKAMRHIMDEYSAIVNSSDPARIPEHRYDEWRRAYWADIRDLKDADYITDKNPWNFDALGMILRLFPTAKIIHTRRNPVETGLSIFCHEFTKFSAFANRLEDIGHYYAEYARLMAHWERVLGDMMLTVQYEDFVAEFDHSAPALLAYCGLETENASASFLNTDRPIATLSAVQVRRGLKVGTGRAERYKSHLGPLVDALRDAGVDLTTGAFIGSR